MNMVLPSLAKCWYKLSGNTMLQAEIGAAGNTDVWVIMRVGMSGAGREMHGKIRCQS